MMARLAHFLPVLPLALAAALTGCGKKSEPRAPSPPGDHPAGGAQPRLRHGAVRHGRAAGANPLRLSRHRPHDRPPGQGRRPRRGGPDSRRRSIRCRSKWPPARRRPISPAPARNSTTPPRRKPDRAALLEKKTTSQAAFDTAEQARAAAQANMTQAEANLAKAQEQLSYADPESRLFRRRDGDLRRSRPDCFTRPGDRHHRRTHPRDAVIDATDTIVDALCLGEKFNVSLQIDPAATRLGNHA